MAIVFFSNSWTFGNGEFFVWNGNVLTSLGNDVYSLGPSSSQNALTVDANSSFYLIPGGGSYTLAQLKSSAVSGITSNTKIAIWVGIATGGGSLTATITSLQKPGVTQPYSYTGREYDPESGLYYYRARYYDPISGRFISKDPIGLRGGINLYSYVGNNPINKIDPFGLDPMTGPTVPDTIFNPYNPNNWPSVPEDPNAAKVREGAKFCAETARDTVIDKLLKKYPIAQSIFNKVSIVLGILDPFPQEAW